MSTRPILLFRESKVPYVASGLLGTLVPFSECEEFEFLFGRVGWTSRRGLKHSTQVFPCAASRSHCRMKNDNIDAMCDGRSNVHPDTRISFLSRQKVIYLSDSFAGGDQLASLPRGTARSGVPRPLMRY